MSNVLRMNSVRRKRRNLASTTVPDAIDFSEGPGPARAVVYPERELPPGGVPAYLAARKSGARSFVLWADEDRRERVATVVTESAVDWHAQRDRYRPTVDAGTTPDELFAVFSEMVEPLHDAHVAVQDGDRVFARPRPGTVVPNGKLDARIKKFIVERDLGNARNLQDFAAWPDHLRRPPRRAGLSADLRLRRVRGRRHVPRRPTGRARPGAGHGPRRGTLPAPEEPDHRPADQRRRL